MNTTSRACWTFSRGGEEPVAKVIPFFGAVNLAAMSGLCTHRDQSASPQRWMSQLCANPFNVHEMGDDWR